MNKLSLARRAAVFPRNWLFRHQSGLRHLRNRLHPRAIARRRETGAFAWGLAEAAIDRGALHKQYELAKMFALVAELKPRGVLEIGLSVGGTFEVWPLLAAEDAVIAGLDLTLSAVLCAVPPPARDRQRIELIEGDSHARATLERVKGVFPAGLDFVFIDGDHAYAGAKQDYQMYGSLVRKGGLVMFHDINADYRERYGRDCPEDSGQVYKLWAELKAAPGALEVIESPGQSGLGIGVVRFGAP